MSTKKEQKDNQENQELSSLLLYLEEKLSLRPSRVASLLGTTRGTYGQWRWKKNKLPIDVFLHIIDTFGLNEKIAIKLLRKDYAQHLAKLSDKYLKDKPRGWRWKT